MVRGVFGPLQLVPDCVRDQDVRKRSQGLQSVESTIHFPVDKPLPVALLKKMVKARLAEMESKKRGEPRWEGHDFYSCRTRPRNGGFQPLRLLSPALLLLRTRSEKQVPRLRRIIRKRMILLRSEAELGVALGTLRLRSGQALEAVP